MVEAGAPGGPRSADDLALSIDAKVEVRIEVDHDHGDGGQVPMIEQAEKAQLPIEGDSARVYYRCPACGAGVIVGAVAQAVASPLLGIAAD